MNNLPVGAVRQMGADVVVAVDADWRRDSIWQALACLKPLSGTIGGLIATLDGFTRPVDRQHGLGVAITLLTFQQALQSGFQIGALQTIYPNALRLYHRMGFEAYCKFGIYQRVWGK